MPNDLYLVFETKEYQTNPMDAVRGIFYEEEEAIALGLAIVLREETKYIQVTWLDVVGREMRLMHGILFDYDEKRIQITNDRRIDQPFSFDAISIEDAIARAGIPADKFLIDAVQEYLDVPNHSYQVGDTVFLPIYEIRFWAGCYTSTPFEVLEIKARRVLVAPDLLTTRLIGERKQDWVYAPYLRRAPE
jgi:hypothetical protein